MKRLLCALVVVFIAIGGVEAQESKKMKKTPWPLKPRNAYVETMIKLDSINRVYMGDPTDIDDSDIEALAIVGDDSMSAEERIEGLVQAKVEANEMWHRFVWLCNKGKFVEALNYYDENQLNIDIALSHSQVRLAFHDQVLGNLAYEYLPINEAIDLMIECLNFDLMMLSVQYGYSGHDYILEAYDYVYELLMQLYLESDRKDDCLALVDRWAEIFGDVFEPEVVELNTLVRKSDICVKMDDKDSAVIYLKGARSVVEGMMSEGYDSAELTELLNDIDKSLADLGVDAK
ncbi:MAG: hypothetical protein IIX19_05670 [Alistipes sp.]|nr:hypothetical protein [Alistipes sp.]